jgi:hypothetical protein
VTSRELVTVRLGRFRQAQLEPDLVLPVLAAAEPAAPGHLLHVGPAVRRAERPWRKMSRVTAAFGAGRFV